MICDECRDRLLGMESMSIAFALGRSNMAERPGAVERPDEGLRATAAHVRSCPECRQVAERILAEEAGLRRELAGLAPAGSPARAARMARIESTRRRTQLRRRVGWAAAAAGLAGVLGIRMAASVGPPNASPSAEAPGWKVASADSRIWLPEVEVPDHENVVVFETADRDVVVFWFYEGRER
jgi:anti-sigma factor RsiW